MPDTVRTCMYFLVNFGVFEWLHLVVEGLNVINDPRCNKVLNVITFCPKCNNNLPYLKLPITVITRISAALK